LFERPIPSEVEEEGVENLPPLGYFSTRRDRCQAPAGSQAPSAVRSSLEEYYRWIPAFAGMTFHRKPFDKLREEIGGKEEALRLAPLAQGAFIA